MGDVVRVKVWNITKEYDVVAPPDTDVFNYFCLKQDILDKICKDPIKIGIYTFEPNNPYTKFGSTKKTSAGFIYFHAEEPIYYYGHYNEHILFTKTRTPVKDQEGYKHIFFTWAFDKERTILITTNAYGAGRVMEMDQ